jgi:glycosyltransferase involved in cell wall biosynthesis
MRDILVARVLFACSASPDYLRNQTILRGLRQYHEVQCLVSSSQSYPFRFAAVLPRALLTSRRFDVYVAGFLGQPIVPFFRLGGATPIILDAFVSVYDTLCLDRRSFSPGSLVGRVARWLDSKSLNWAASVLTDTAQQATFLSTEFAVPGSKLVPIPVGVNEDLFFPQACGRHEGTRVLYYSTFLPLHGAHIVIEAAKLLEDKREIQFTLIGDGPERARVEGLAQKYGLANCEFMDSVPLDSLPGYIANADIFLGGHFNADNDKAKRVVPGKVFQALAMAKPVIVGDCAANGEWFEHLTNGYVVPMGNAARLAEGIAELSRSRRMRGRIGDAGRDLYTQHFSEAAIALRLNQCIETMLGRLEGRTETDSRAT